MVGRNKSGLVPAFVAMGLTFLTFTAISAKAETPYDGFWILDERNSDTIEAVSKIPILGILALGSKGAGQVFWHITSDDGGLTVSIPHRDLTFKKISVDGNSARLRDDKKVKIEIELSGDEISGSFLHRERKYFVSGRRSPYVLQSRSTIARQDEEIESLNMEVLSLRAELEAGKTASPKNENLQGVRNQIDSLQDRLKSLQSKFVADVARLEAENSLLRERLGAADYKPVALSGATGTYVTSTRANLRNLPSVGSRVIRTLPQGTTVEVSGRTEDGMWFQVASKGEPPAFIFAELLKPKSSNLAVVSAMENAPPSPLPADKPANPGQIVAVTGDEAKRDVFSEKVLAALHPPKTTSEATSSALFSQIDFGNAVASSLAFAPNSDQVFVGLNSNHVRLLDAQTLKTVRDMAGHTGGVRSVATSPDGKWVASGSEDNSVRIWNAFTGEAVQVLQGHTASNVALAFSPDGTLLLSGSRDKTVRVWNVADGELTCTFLEHKGPVVAVATIPNTPLVLSSVSNPRGNTGILIWNMRTCRPEGILKGHQGAVYALAVSSDGRTAASGSQDRTVKIWDIAAANLVKTLGEPDGHEGSVRGVAISSDGRYVASGSDDRMVKVWDIPTGKLVTSIPTHKGRITALAFSSDNNLLASVSRDGKAYFSPFDEILKAAKKEQPKSAQTVKQPTQIASLPPERPTVSSIAIETSGIGLPQELDFAGAVAGSLVFTPDGGHLLAGAGDKILMLETTSGRTTHKLAGHESAIMAIAVNAKNTFAVSGSRDADVRLWNLATGKQAIVLGGHEKGAPVVTFAAQGEVILTGSGKGKVSVWNATDGKLICSFSKHKGGISAVAAVPGSKLVLSASSSKRDRSEIRVWNRENCITVGTLKGHRGPVYALAFSPDGSLALSGSRDKTIKVWDAKDMRLRQTLGLIDGHASSIRAVALTPDGKHVISGSDDKTLMVWELKSGDLLRTVRDHEGKITALTISPDGNFLVSSGKGKKIRVREIKKLVLAKD